MSKDDLDILYKEMDVLEDKLDELQCKYFDKTLNLSEKELNVLEKEMQYIKTYIMEKEEVVKSIMMKVKIEAEKTCSTYQKEYNASVEQLVKKRIIPVNVYGEPVKNLGHNKWSK